MPIKLYQCPKCGDVHTAERWNAETIMRYGEPIAEIDEDEEEDCTNHFICPTCKEVILRVDIKEIKK